MEEYPNEYEKVESNPERLAKYCAIREITPFGDEYPNTTAYLGTFRETVLEMEHNYFDGIVKFMWLARKFMFRGKLRKKYRRNGYYPDRAWGMFLRNYVGLDNRIWFTRHSLLTKIVTYMDDFFPNFDEGNPFKEKYEFPFKFITLDYLYVVIDLPERMDLLRIAERKQLPYTEYLDYLSNYVGCYNDRHGKEILRTMFINPNAPHIKVLKDK